jgi:hypothetical protein
MEEARVRREKISFMLDSWYFNVTFNNISVLSWRSVFDGGNRSTSKSNYHTITATFIKLFLCSGFLNLLSILSKKKLSFVICQYVIYICGPSWPWSYGSWIYNNLYSGHILQNILKKNSSLKNIVKFYKINECIGLCKSQTTIHHVPTESGRWNDIARNYNKCRLCTSDNTVYKFHYLLECFDCLS